MGRLRYHLNPALLSGWFFITSQGPARAGFLGPGRITLGAHFGRVDRDPQLARGLLLKSNSKVLWFGRRAAMYFYKIDVQLSTV